jgi:hypothetical protein
MMAESSSVSLSESCEMMIGVGLYSLSLQHEGNGQLCSQVKGECNEVLTRHHFHGLL